MVYLDLDGVLADFDARVNDIFGKSPSQVPSKELWQGIAHFDKTVEPFFENLPMMDDAHDLIRFVDTHFKKWAILTASGYTPKNVAEQKRKWVAKTIHPSINVIVVRKSEEKANYATSNSILVDDRMKSIQPWRNAGGIGILHTSASDSIEQLTKHL